jgi:alanyl-tRNA synthetase
VTQKGSLVAADRLRFDFSQSKPLTAEDVAVVEAAVNAQIRGNQPVSTRLMTPDAAIAAGAMALFGEKYGDEVRVLSMGDADEGAYSTELCGGTHVRALGDIGLFKIISEGAVASGVRRIEALTGEAARLFLVEQENRLKAAAALLKARPDEVAARVEALAEERKRLERELAEAKRALALAGPATGGGPTTESVGGAGFIGQVIEGLEAKSLRGLVDEAKAKLGSGVAVLVAVNDGRASVAVGVTDDLTAKRSAVDLVRLASAAVGGQGGGGRPDFAQAGGPDGAKAADAVAAVRAALAG